MQFSTRPRTTRPAFTLVELLVVIGIIALLISILLPALNSARRAASTVKCLSNMRQIGNCYMLYARDYRGTFPVMRQDYPDDGWIGNSAPPSGRGPQNTINRYWFDFLIPYYNSKAIAADTNGNMTVSSGTLTQKQFDAQRASIFWGCPNWTPWVSTSTGYGFMYNADVGSYVDVFSTGYSMNIYPTAKPNYPTTFSFPPSWETQSRSTAAGGVGRWYKQSQWTMPSQRMLVGEANLWFLLINPTDAAGTIAPQNAFRAVASGTGANQLDRYRHGKRPGITGTTFGTANVTTTSSGDPGGGKTSFNVLYADYHASTMTDVREGFKSIRMRYP